MLARLWQENRKSLPQASAGQTARTFMGSQPAAYFSLYVLKATDFYHFIYGDGFQDAVTAQQLLTPCLATAFLHNLAAYAMIGMQRQKLLFIFIFLACLSISYAVFTLIPKMPLEGAALSLTITKSLGCNLHSWLFQWHAHPMSARQWALMLAVCACSVILWAFLGKFMPREGAELAGLLPLLALLWYWRPPPPL